jgi:hypothetical protein
VKRRPLGGAGAADRITQQISGTAETTRSARDPQALRCASCGVAGSLPAIHPISDAGARLTIAWLHNRFVLVCDACKLVIALDRAARARRAGR